MADKPRIDPALVQEFVNNAHSDFPSVRDLLQRQPALINAAWDWGAGDWETGLGAAAHMGRWDIAQYLLERSIYWSAARGWTSSRRRLGHTGSRR